MSRSPIELHFVHGIAVITLNGELDASNVQHLGQACDKGMSVGRNRIVLNCEPLSSMSSAVLGVLVSYIQETRERGGGTRIVSRKSWLRSVFGLLGFSTTAFYGTVEEALDGFDL